MLDSLIKCTFLVDYQNQLLIGTVNLSYSICVDDILKSEILNKSFKNSKSTLRVTFTANWFFTPFFLEEKLKNKRFWVSRYGITWVFCFPNANRQVQFDVILALSPTDYSCVGHTFSRHLAPPSIASKFF